MRKKEKNKWEVTKTVKKDKWEIKYVPEQKGGRTKERKQEGKKKGKTRRSGREEKKRGE